MRDVSEIDPALPRPLTMRGNVRTCYWCNAHLHLVKPKHPDADAFTAWLACYSCDRIDLKP